MKEFCSPGIYCPCCFDDLFSQQIDRTTPISADEPAGKLDGETEENIMNILCALAHEENRCVIIVARSRHVANRYADELWGLNKGNLVFVK